MEKKKKTNLGPGEQHKNINNNTVQYIYIYDSRISSSYGSSSSVVVVL